MSGLDEDDARKLAQRLGFSNVCVDQAVDTIKKLYNLFITKDCTLLEINPLVETNDHYGNTIGKIESSYVHGRQNEF